MPNLALVAFGVALGFGLLTLSPPAWCSEVNITQEVISQAPDITPETTITQADRQTESLPVLTLAEAVERTLQHNLALTASADEVKARGFEAEQAGFYPNPEISVEMENFAGSGEFSGTDSAEATLLLSQRFELGDKRSRRQAVGRLNEIVAEQEYTAVYAELTAETTERFVALLAAQKRLALAEEQTSLASKVLATVNERIESGKTARVEKLRFQSLVAEAHLRTEQAGYELTAARHSLAALWNQGDLVDFAAVQGNFEQLSAVPDWPELLARIPQSPTIISRQATIRQAERSFALEQAKSIPDLTLSLGAKNFEATNDNALVAGVSISLPLFDRNQGAISAARVRQTKAENSARAARSQLQAELSEVWLRLQTAGSEAAMLRDELLPAVQQGFDAITYGYQAGKFGFLEVLDAEKALFETRSRYVDSLEKYHQIYTELERLLGQELAAEGKAFVPSFYSERGQS